MRIRKQQRFESSSTMYHPVLASLDEPNTAASDGKTDVVDYDVDTLLYHSPKFRASFNWLNKLRAAKGFPVEPELCMEEFLGSPDSPSSRDPLPPFSFRVAASSSSLNNVDRNSARASNNIATGTHVHDTNTASIVGDYIEQNHTLHSIAELSCPDSLRSRSPEVRSISPPRHIAKTGAEDGIPVELAEDPTETSPSTPDTPNNLFADIFAMDDRLNIDHKLTGQRRGFIKRHKRKQEKPRLCPTSSVSVLSGVTNTFSDMFVKEEDAKPLQTCVAPHEGEYQDMDSTALAKTVDYSIIAQEEKEKPVTEKNPLEQSDIAKSNIDAIIKRQDFESLVVSQSEILVIDTSLSDWKAGKILQRRGKSWKIRDKQNVPGSGSTGKKKKVSRRGSSRSNMAKSGNMVDANSNNVAVKLSSEKNGLQIMQFGQLKTKGLLSCEVEFNTSGKRRKGLPGYNVFHEKGSMHNDVPQSDLRPCKKRRAGIGSIDAPAIVKKDTQCSPVITADLAADHPANQPKETLTFSVYDVFLQAGKAGLTAREAVSRILERGLPGLHEGGVVPRVEVLKIISNSPYFMLLEESKYILCSALVGDWDYESIASKQDERNLGKRLESVKREKQQSISQYWAAWAAIRRARTGKTRRKPSLIPCILDSTPSQEISESMSGLSCKKRLKFMKQEVAGLGNPCNRSDGKGWHCPLRAKVGYLLCDHHLDRLRIKSHLKSKMLSMNNVSTADKIRARGDSWMVKKVVERSRMDRHSQVEQIQSKSRDTAQADDCVSNAGFNFRVI